MAEILPIANENVYLVGKAILILVLGILIGFFAKYVLRKLADKLILKKLFKKDISTYETSSLINKVITEIIQWIIIVIALNEALTLLNFNLLSKASSLIIAEIPNIVIFVALLAAGLLIAKLIASKVRASKDIERKEEISFIIEIVIVAAFGLAAFEFIGIKATALLELFKVILYVIAVLIVLLLIRPNLFKNPKSLKLKVKTK